MPELNKRDIRKLLDEKLPQAAAPTAPPPLPASAIPTRLRRLAMLEEEINDLLDETTNPDAVRRCQERLERIASVRTRLAGVKRFTLSEKPYKPGRKLTLQEERVGMEELNDAFNRVTGTFEKKMGGLLADERKRMGAAIKNKLNAGDIAAIAAFTVYLSQSSKKAIKSLINQSYHIGRTFAAKEAGIARPPVPLDSTKIMALEATDASDQLVNNLTARVKGVVKAGFAAGSSNDAIVAAAQQEFDDEAEKAVSNMAGTYSGQYVNRGRMDVFSTVSDKIVSYQWSAVLDDATCFPAGTKIITDKGERDISKIKKGDRVLTRAGFEEVVKTGTREYDGALIKISAGRRSFVCTAEHPIFSNGKWIKANEIKVGDLVCQFRADKRRQISAMINRLFGKTDHRETGAGEITVLPGVARFVSVPVSAVRFYTNPQAGDKKINSITAESRLLDERNAERFKGDAEPTFEPALAEGSSATSDGTEPRGFGVGRRTSKSLPALFARNQNGRPATFLGAELHAAAVGIKKFIAAFARAVDGAFCAALPRTEIITAGVGSGDGKLLGATDTDFDNALANIAAFKRTETRSAPSDKGSAAYDTLFDLFHNKQVKNGTTQVYNIEVKSQHEYLAEGILVHNCDMCASLDGQVCTPDDPFISLDIVHSHCRCVWVPIFADDEEQPEPTDIPKGIADNFRTIDGKPVVNSFKQLKKPIPQSEKAKQTIAQRKG